MRLRKLILPVVAVALVVTGCGGDDAPEGDQTPASDDAADDGASADDSSDEADEEESDTGDDAPGGNEVDAAALFTALAAAMVASGSYEFETTMNAGGEQVISGAVELATDVSEANMQIMMDVLGTGTQSEIRIVDGQFFMELDESMGLPGGGSWITLDPDGDDPFSQQMTGAFAEIGSATNLIAQLAEQPDLLTVIEVGSDTVDGVDTTQYHVVVNDVGAFQGLSESDAGSGELSFMMWIDGDDLLRRMTTEADGSVSIEMVYSNYGADVTVDAPPADEVIDLSEMISQ